MKKPNYMLIILSSIWITLSSLTRRKASILFIVAAMISDVTFIVQFIRNKRNG